MPASQQQLGERKGFSVRRSESSQPENKLLVSIRELCLACRVGPFPLGAGTILFRGGGSCLAQVPWTQVPPCCPHLGYHPAGPGAQVTVVSCVSGTEE